MWCTCVYIINYSYIICILPGTHICLFACLFCLSLVLSSPPHPHPSIHPSIYSLIQLSIYACIYIYIYSTDRYTYSIHTPYDYRYMYIQCMYIYIYILIYYRLPLPLHTKAGKSSQLHVCLGGQGAPLALGHPWRLDDAFGTDTSNICSYFFCNEHDGKHDGHILNMPPCEPHQLVQNENMFYTVPRSHPVVRSGSELGVFTSFHIPYCMREPRSYLYRVYQPHDSD